MTHPVPQSAYTERAANRERPPEWDDAFYLAHLGQDHDELHRMAVAVSASVASVHTFGCDWSKYQVVVDSSYPLPWGLFRLDSGYSLDSHAQANMAAVERIPTLKLVEGYLVHIPGNESAQLARIKSLFGKNGPGRYRFMVDEESGKGFAGPGDHSSGATWLANELADFTGTQKGVRPYANQYDYTECLPHIPDWFDERAAVAAYSSVPPSRHWYTWQYAGGDPRWSSPSGYPRSVKPFGAFVDFNVCNRSIDQMLVDYGLATPQEDDVDEDRVAEMIQSALLGFARGGDHGRFNRETYPGLVAKPGEGVLDRLDDNHSSIVSLKKKTGLA